uniref:[histone H3]-lysine(4) N-trimethyltransferase n=1 Tax=Pseudictyota dubia TaxID=2749911 RepID=A0A7R9VS13_9STRA
MAEDAPVAPQAKFSPPKLRYRGSADGSVTNAGSAPTGRENEQDRQVIAEAHKEDADELVRKCIFIACCGILMGLLRRDPLRLFAEPVPPNIEGYAKIVKRPIDFSVIRRRVLKGRYTTLKSFVQDARLLCANALVFNPEGSIYAITAKDLYESLEAMQKRASYWISAMRNAHASHFAKFGGRLTKDTEEPHGEVSEESGDHTKGSRSEDDPFREIRVSWPGAAEMLDQGDYFKSQLRSDFLRTRENETAYYGTLVVRRIAAAAEASLASTPELGGMHQPCVRRSFKGDETLRDYVDLTVAGVNGPVQLRDEPSWREESVLRFLRNIQNRRIETRTSSESGCARCDGVRTDAEEAKLAMREATMRRRRRSDGVRPRVHESRLGQSAGLASANARERVANEAEAGEDTLRTTSGEVITSTARDKSVSVRGSRIHGWGLYTDHPFRKGEIVAEYVGEYVSNAVADAREKMYRRMRIQDYQFRVNNDLVIDATLQGGHARYINHSCDPNCAAKIIEGRPPNKQLKRVIIVSQRNIPAMEEITYDYQFPLELDLAKRIPCNCGSKLCRGFMNWDLPEVGSKTTRYQMMKASRTRDRATRKAGGRMASTRQMSTSNK